LTYNKSFHLVGDDQIPCEGCPIKEKTGQRYCGGTPWDQVGDLDGELSGSWLEDFEREAKWEEFKEHAMYELEFLKNLLEELKEREVK